LKSCLFWHRKVASSLAGETSVHLSVDSAGAHLDLEGALVTPGVVPGVDTEPVVFTVFSAPTDGLDSVTTESRARLVRVDTRLVGQEVLVDCEGSGYSTVLEDIVLDLVDIVESVA